MSEKEDEKQVVEFRRKKDRGDNIAKSAGAKKSSQADQVWAFYC